MSCSIYKVNKKTDGYGFELELSNPLLSISHTKNHILNLLHITEQVGEGDKLIILYKKDIVKAISFYKSMIELQFLLDSIGDNKFEFYYIDGV